jgi:hypothetical protein
MAERRSVCFGSIRFENRTSQANGNPGIYAGHCTTRATVLAQVGNSPAVGSLYLSSQGKLYVKAANNGAAADWEKVTQTAAD